MLKKEDFVKKIQEMLTIAKENGQEYLDVVSGDVHRKLGGYPGKNHAMPTCCDVMYEMMKPGDEVLVAPVKKRGATVKIRYFL